MMKVTTVGNKNGLMAKKATDDNQKGVDHGNAEKKDKSGQFGTGKNGQKRQEKTGQTFGTVTGHNGLREKIEREKTQISTGDGTGQDNNRPLQSINGVTKT